MLSNNEINQKRELGDIFIYPFAKSSLTGCGYNLTASYFVISAKKKMLETLYNKNGDVYVWVNPNDTILICTREYMSVSEKIAGTIHSRVKIVSKGFGHISTTIDPSWRGPLLIALNNPSRKRKKFILVKNGVRQTFATVVFHSIEPTSYKHDNVPARLDILNEYIASESLCTFLNNKYSLFIDIVKRLQHCMENNIVFYEDVESSLRTIQHSSADNCHIEINDLLCKKIANDLLNKELLKQIKKCIQNKTKDDGEFAVLIRRCQCEKGENWLAVINEIEDQIQIYSKYVNGLFIKWNAIKVNAIFILASVAVITLQIVAFIQNMDASKMFDQIATIGTGLIMTLTLLAMLRWPISK